MPDKEWRMIVNADRSLTVDGPALVDALNGVFGKHKSAHASHAKGLSVEGTFMPTSQAAALSKAPHFARPTTFVGRFSMGGGNPKIADHAKPAPRGFSVKFDLGNDQTTDLVMISTPMFFASTPAQMQGFLQARFPGADGKPDTEKVKAFTAANPETGKQAAWLAGRPVPASYAGVNYWAVHAFTLTNAAGESTIVKFKAVPSLGEVSLSDEDLTTASADFYSGELAERLGNGPITFDLIAIIGEKGDQTNNASNEWPESERKQILLGRLSIASIRVDQSRVAPVFDPTNLAIGISGPKDDPMFAVRASAYAESFARRTV
jgi:catalase